jgi:hypothetical protein
MSPACAPPAVVRDLLCAFDGVDGQWVRARVVLLERSPHVAFALDAGRVDATLAEHVRLLLPIWCVYGCSPAMRVCSLQLPCDDQCAVSTATA